MTNLPILRNAAHGAVVQGDTAHTPLGTAAWHRFEGGKAMKFRTGDLWLSRHLTGEPAGYRDDRHVLLVSDTRMGKGASVIVPNLCLWPGSVVVIDPKGENAMVTARRRGQGSAYSRGMGQRVLILDPFGEVVRGDDDFADMRAAFNPLDVILTRKREAVDDAARIADALIVSEGGGDSFFDDTAKGIIKALILHVASDRNYAEHQRNLLTLRRVLLAGDEDMRRMLQRNGVEELPSGISLLFIQMKCNNAFGGVVAKHGAMLLELLDNSPRTLMSALQVARTNTDFLDSPALCACLDSSTFQLSDLKSTPTSLYLCLPQRFMGSHYRWLRMMTTLILGEMERTRVKVPPKHPMLMVLDEFPALGRMKVIENAAAQIAGYGVKMMFVAQTMAQLKDVYKDNWETMVANAGVKLFFGNDDNFTREYISKMIGDLELRRWAQSHSHSEGRTQSTSHGTQQGVSGNRTKGSSSSASFGGQSGRFTFGDSRSVSEGWSRGESHNTTQGTSEGHTKGASETFHKRPLLTPDEVGRVFSNRDAPAMLVLISGLQPIAFKRSLYFADPVMAEKFDPHRDHALPLTRAQLAKRDMNVFFKHILAPPPIPDKPATVMPPDVVDVVYKDVTPVQPASKGLMRAAIRSAMFMVLKILIMGGGVMAYALAVGF